MNPIKLMNLQLFADGASGDGEGTGDATAEVVADISNEIDATDNESTDLESEYDELMNGRFKEIHKKRTNSDFNKRFRDHKKLEKSVRDTQPLIDALSERYGIDKKDTAGLLEAFNYDKLYVRERAAELGMDDDEFIEHDRIKRKAQSFDRLQEEEQRRTEFNEKYNGWKSDAASLQKQYPSFDFDTEFMENSDFREMVAKGVPVRNAFLAIHHDDIMAGTVKYAVDRTAENVSRQVARQKARPTENGMSSQASLSSKVDVANLSGAEIRDYIRRIENGEKITFR